MRLFKFIYVPFLLLFCIISGCNIINPEESIPAFVEIKAMNLAPNSNFGSNSSNIKDVWVYADGQFIGTFELPAKFPVLLAGNHNFQFGAGIFKNGIASTRAKYPFYKFDARTLNLTEGQTISIDTLTVEYFSGLKAKIVEGFEGSSFPLDTLSTSLAPLAFDTANAFEGKKCLKLEVTSLDSVLECKTNGPYNYFDLGKSVYLELDYKCDEKFYIGIMSTASLTSKAILLQVNPSATWNKIYLDLSQTVVNYGISNGFQIYFLLKKDLNTTKSTVYLDNLKLLQD